jgi:hypothetical protein
MQNFEGKASRVGIIVTLRRILEATSYDVRWKKVADDYV